jgi:hypothetical protein
MSTMLDDITKCWMKILNKVKSDPTLPKHSVETRPTKLHSTMMDHVGPTCWPRNGWP